MKKRTVALLTALTLTLGCAVGGTLAWLTDTTEEVKNTFTTSDIEITLNETEEKYKMIPGWSIHKDPAVTVEAGSEACYLFVKLEKSDNFDAFMTYEVAEGWGALEGVAGVYYRVVEAKEEDQVFSVLQDNQVLVKETVTKEQMNALTEEAYPTLTVTAYASQQYKNNMDRFTSAEAWTNVQPVAE